MRWLRRRGSKLPDRLWWFILVPRGSAARSARSYCQLGQPRGAVSHAADATAVGLPAPRPGPAHSPVAPCTALACGASACTPAGQKVQPCADRARHCRLAHRPHRYSSPIRSTRYAAPTVGPHRSHVYSFPPSPATALPGPVPPLEHRRAGSTVQDVDLGKSPCLPHHPAEQGTDLLRAERHAPSGITAARASLDDALVVAETIHRAPPSRSPVRRSPKARSDTHRDQLMCACQSTGDGSTPACPVITAAAPTRRRLQDPARSSGRPIRDVRQRGRQDTPVAQRQRRAPAHRPERAR